MKFKLLLTIITLLIFAAQSNTQDTIVVQFNEAFIQSHKIAGLNSNVSFRALFLMHTAMYNAWAHFDSTAIPYQVETFSRQPESKRTLANKQIAASYAAYYVAKTLVPSQQSLFDQVMQNNGYEIQTLPTDPKSAAYIGIKAAKKLLKARENDNSNQLGNLNPSGTPYSEPILLPGYQPYEYVNTADALNDINYWQPLTLPDGTVQVYQTPHWGLVDPFALSSGSQFRPEEGPYRTSDWADFIGQAQQIYDIGNSLTPEQKLIADYWQGTKDFQPRQWSRVTQYVSRRDGNSLDDDIKLFFAVAAAQFDGSIASFDTKRAYNSVRPITVINNYIDLTWESYIITSPHPEYVAGHPATSSPARYVLEAFTGSDYYGGSYTDPTTGITLHWDTFTDALHQVEWAGMYAGIHYRLASVTGSEQGEKVGQVAWEKTQDLIEGHA